MPIFFDDSYDALEREVILNNFGKTFQERWKIAESIYKNNGFSNTLFKLYPGLGHSVNDIVYADLLDFFKQYVE